MTHNFYSPYVSEILLLASEIVSDLLLLNFPHISGGFASGNTPQDRINIQMFIVISKQVFSGIVQKSQKQTDTH
jgi:hypothetical protein